MMVVVVVVAGVIVTVVEVEVWMNFVKSLSVRPPLYVVISPCQISLILHAHVKGWVGKQASE